jgi:hypothetical protein
MLGEFIPKVLVLLSCSLKLRKNGKGNLISRGTDTTTTFVLSSSGYVFALIPESAIRPVTCSKLSNKILISTHLTISVISTELRASKSISTATKFCPNPAA